MHYWSVIWMDPTFGCSHDWQEFPVVHLQVSRDAVGGEYKLAVRLLGFGFHLYRLRKTPRPLAPAAVPSFKSSRLIEAERLLRKMYDELWPGDYRDMIAAYFDRTGDKPSAVESKPG